MLLISWTHESNGWLGWLFWNSKKGCVFDLNWDIPHVHQPVILRKGPHGFELALPTKERNLKFHYKEEIGIACPGPTNDIMYMYKDGIHFAIGMCYKLNGIKFDRTLSKPIIVKCSKEIETVIRPTGKICAAGLGEELLVGYDANEGFHTLLTVCYNRTTVRTLYSINVLYSMIQGAETRNQRPPWIKGPPSLYPDNFDVHETYKYTNQEKVFERIVGKKMRNQYLKPTFLYRAHLASGKDFLMGAWQFSSNCYVNLIPQWQSINIGHWYKLEKIIRKAAAFASVDYVITTGTYGVMTAEDEDSNVHEIYLEPERKLLPVPALTWKIVLENRNKSCIVFLMTNNPFQEKPDPIICNSICLEHGWPDIYVYPYRGYMYCCTIEDFRSAVPYAPEFECLSVLDKPDDYNPKKYISFARQSN